jgi:hypothetical protein
MDRREFLKSLAVVAGGLAVGGDVLGAKAGKISRSNIFFFFADDWGRYASVYKFFGPNGTFFGRRTLIGLLVRVFDLIMLMLRRHRARLVGVRCFLGSIFIERV